MDCEKADFSDPAVARMCKEMGAAFGMNGEDVYWTFVSYDGVWFCKDGRHVHGVRVKPNLHGREAGQ